MLRGGCERIDKCLTGLWDEGNTSGSSQWLKGTHSLTQSRIRPESCETFGTLSSSDSRLWLCLKRCVHSLISLIEVNLIEVEVKLETVYMREVPRAEKKTLTTERE